jgi:hypothetical protein
MKGGGWINLFRRFNAKEGARSKLNGVSGKLMHEGRSVRKEEVEFRGVGSDFSSKVGSCSKEARSGHVTVTVR